MLRFGIIAEGVTDRRVLRALLLCALGDVQVNPIQPPEPVPGEPPPFGGFEQVFRALREGRHREALQQNDYVIVHLDTDVSEHPNFGVSWREDGRELTPTELVERVIRRLLDELGAAFMDEHADRILFAIPVHAIECWILALLHDGARSEKIAGCLEAADRELARLKLPTLQSKHPRAYDEVMRQILRKRKPETLHGQNQTLDLFLAQLDLLPT